MCTTSKTVNYLLAWVILFFICPPLQCFFFTNPFRALIQPQPIKAQPITFKVPKKKLKEVTELLKTNPEYLRELTVNPRNSKIPITFAPKGPINPSINGYPTLPYGRYGTTTQLPDEVMINGEKHFKTTRGSLLLNQGLKWLNKAIPATTVPSIPYDLVNYNQNTNKPKQNEKEKVDDDSEYEYEYEYEDEDDEDDQKKKDNNDSDNKDSNTSDKKYANPEKSKGAKGNQRPNKKQKYKDSIESVEDLTDDDNDE